jgi:hypothetical protein
VNTVRYDDALKVSGNSPLRPHLRHPVEEAFERSLPGALMREDARIERNTIFL